MAYDPPIHRALHLNKHNVPTDAAPLDLTRTFELYINSTSVRLYPEEPPVISSNALAVTAMTGTPSNTSPATQSINEFLQYSRQEASKWLIDLTHDICNPANLHGSLLVWKVPNRQWCLVADTDPLTASMYRYHLSAGITVGLLKTSLRVRKFVTTVNGDANTMAGRVEQTSHCPLSNSHTCRKAWGIIYRFPYFYFSSLPQISQSTTKFLA